MHRGNEEARRKEVFQGLMSDARIEERKAKKSRRGFPFVIDLMLTGPCYKLANYRLRANAIRRVQVSMALLARALYYCCE